MSAVLITLSLLILLNPFSTPSPGKNQVKWVADSKGKKIRKEEETLYNDKGDIIKEVQYTNGMQPLCEVFTFEYTGGHKTRKIKTFCDGKGDELTIYTYDKLGRLVNEVDYDSKKRVIVKRINTYKSNSKNIESTASLFGDEKQAHLLSTFEYYANGLVKKETQTIDGSWNQTQNYQYDADKHLIYEDAEVDGGVGVVKYYYTYQNNLLVKDWVKVPDTGIQYHLYENGR